MMKRVYLNAERSSRRDEKKKAEIDGLASNRGVAAGQYKAAGAWRIEFFRGDIMVAFLTESTELSKAKQRAAAEKYIADGFADRYEEKGKGAIRAKKIS